MLAEGGEELIQIMEKLGFEKLGKDFINKQLHIYIEFPGRGLKPSEQSILLKVKNRNIQIISIEDLIIDRLCAFKFWKTEIEGVNALLLMENNEVDETRLFQRAQEEQVADALDGILKIREQIIRKKIPPKSANQMLENLMEKLK